MQYETSVIECNAYKAIALEAEILSNTVTTIGKFFPQFMQTVNAGFSKLNALSGFSGDMKSGKMLTSAEKNILSHLANVEYTDLERLALDVPEGFKGNIVSYVQTLLEGFQYFDTEMQKNLDEFYIKVASILTNKDAKLSLRDDSRVYSKMAKERQDENSKVGKYFKPGSSQATLNYGTCFSRNDDVYNFFMDAHTLESKLKAIDLNVISSKTSKINDALESLIKQVNAGTIERVSPEVTKNLAAGAHEMASQVEYFAIHYYRCMAILTSASLVTEKLARRLE